MLVSVLAMTCWADRQVPPGRPGVMCQWVNVVQDEEAPNHEETPNVGGLLFLDNVY